MIPIYATQEDESPQKPILKPANDRLKEMAEELTTDPHDRLQETLEELSIGSDVDGILKELSAVALNVNNILHSFSKKNTPENLERNLRWLQDQWQRLQNMCGVIQKVGADIEALSPAVEAVIRPVYRKDSKDPKGK
jgi:hypothetical protein